MANPLSNRKKVRGWKRRIRQLERLRLAYRELNVEALRDGRAQYVKIWLDPWKRLVPRNPPYWFRRRILAALIDIHDSWRRALERTGEPYHVAIWLFHPAFHDTQVVATMGKLAAEYHHNAFRPAPHAAPRPPAAYDDPAYDLGRFRWHAGTDAKIVMHWPEMFTADDLERFAREADHVERASTGDLLYIFDQGTVWRGSLPADSST